MEKYIKTNIDRPNREILREYSKLDVTSVYEAQARTGLLDSSILPRTIENQIVGPAVIATCFAGDNLMIHAAIEQCKPGDILVVSVIGSSTDGMVGDLIASALKKRGVVGLIIEAGVRDIKELKEMEFPVWSKAISSRGTDKSIGGWVNKPSTIGGVLISPGDIILANQDGVVAVKKDNFQTTLEKTLARLKKEKQIRTKINEGKLSLDFHDLRKVLEEQKVIYLD